MHQHQTAFENIMEKGEIARNEQFLLFPQCFLLNQIIVSPSVHILDIIFFLADELEKPKIGISGKGIIGVSIVCWDNIHTVGKKDKKQQILCILLFIVPS